MQFGLQFTLHIQNNHTVPEIVAFAGRAKDLGFEQIWVNDNLRYRSNFVVLTAIASQVPIKVGTAILVPYFRTPVDVADILASLSELTKGREISVGIARGGKNLLGPNMEWSHTISMVMQTTAMLRKLLEGVEVCFGDYPVPAHFFRLRDNARARLAFKPASPIKFYCGGYGPRIIRLGGRFMDGILFGGPFLPMLKSELIEERLKQAEEGRKEAGNGKSLFNICEVNISISRDRNAARYFTKPYIAHSITVFADDELRRLKIDPEEVAALNRIFDSGSTIERAAELVTDKMIDAYFVSGTPEECAEQLSDVCDQAARLGFHQVSLAKLGPNYGEAIRLLGEEVLPAIGFTRTIDSKV